ncbi:hypothetical protein ES707_20387 [subsurface metagenome]
MKKQEKIRYQQLEVGYELPSISYKLEPSMVAAYLRAVQEHSELYKDRKLVPPMAIAAYAMAALSENILLPPGVIHTDGQIQFLGIVNVGDTISCYSRVSQKQDRGRFHLLTIDFTVFNQERKQVLTGKTSFILPELDNES